MNMGNAIKICRVRKGWTQETLAKKADVSASYLSLVENNKRDATLSSVKRIAQRLGVPLSLLMFLAADGTELQGLPEDLRDRMSTLVLKLLSEDRGPQPPLPF